MKSLAVCRAAAWPPAADTNSYSRAGAGALIFSKQAPDVLWGMAASADLAPHPTITAAACALERHDVRAVADDLGVGDRRQDAVLREAAEHR
jgi:hypothetical protein